MIALIICHDHLRKIMTLPSGVLPKDEVVVLETSNLTWVLDQPVRSHSAHKTEAHILQARVLYRRSTMLLHFDGTRHMSPFHQPRYYLRHLWHIGMFAHIVSLPPTLSFSLETAYICCDQR